MEKGKKNCEQGEFEDKTGSWIKYATREAELRSEPWDGDEHDSDEKQERKQRPEPSETFCGSTSEKGDDRT